MRALLRRIWALPWPPMIRHLATELISAPGVRLLLIPHFMVGVVGIIVDDHGRLLLLRHTYRRTYPWGLPTGFLEHGEQPRGALQRELAEETGFSVSLSDIPHVYTTADRPFLNVLYTGRIEAGRFDPDSEISEAQFFAPDDLPRLEPGQDRLVTRFFREAGHAATDGVRS